MMIGLLSMGPMTVGPAFLLEVGDAVLEPEPGEARLTLVEPAFCEPLPVRPGPEPAPLFM